MTNSQRHELCIFVQRFDAVDWARYDIFFIGSEADNYRIKSVGTYNGSTDLMNHHINSEFLTYDRERSYKNWSNIFHGGYWYLDDLKYGNNLNGRYYSSYVLCS